MKKNFNNKGFTLIEIILVIAAVVILAGIVIVAIDPNKQRSGFSNLNTDDQTSTVASTSVAK